VLFSEMSVARGRKRKEGGKRATGLLILVNGQPDSLLRFSGNSRYEGPISLPLARKRRKKKRGRFLGLSRGKNR